MYISSCLVGLWDKWRSEPGAANLAASVAVARLHDVLPWAAYVVGRQLEDERGEKSGESGTTAPAT